MEWEALHPPGPSGLRSGPPAPPGVRPLIPPETPGFNETTTGFKFLLQKAHETANFRPIFTETVHKKKVVSLETAVFAKLSLPEKVIKDKNSLFFENLDILLGVYSHSL